MKALLVLLVAMLAFGFGFGCAPDDRKTILVWHSYRNDSERALIELAARFETEHGVRVELLAVPYDAFSAKLEAAVPRDHGPDVFIDAHERLGSFVRGGIVAPANDAFPDGDGALFDPTSIDAVTMEGTRYGVPLETKCVALYLAGEDRTVATLDEVLEAPSAGDGAQLVYEAEDPYYHAAFLHAFGGRMLDEHEGFGMVGPEASKSLAFVRTMTREHRIPEEPSGALVLQLFSSGKAKAAISGPWLAADLGAMTYTVVPLPPVRGRAMHPMLTVDAAFLTPHGARDPDARALARFLGSTPAAITRATTGRQVVANREAWSDPSVARDRVLAAFHRAAADAIPMPKSTRMRATWVPALQAIRKVLRGSAEPDDALREAKARFDEAVQPAPPPPSPTPLILGGGVVLLAIALLLVRRARSPVFRRELRASRTAWAYTLHAAAVVFVLVVLPLAAGAITSLFAGTRNAPVYVGLENYFSILGGKQFWITLGVTVLWTVLNLVFHVGIGLGLGMALSRPWLRLRAAYRVLLILPWAVPSYVTALAWKGMFHRQFGAMNALLVFFGAQPISWFGKFSTALAANVATNVWLGFPFMMVVVMGALTSIPKDVLEAASVDGASRWQVFAKVTLPLLRPSLLPAIVLGAVWTFNMFNVVFLVSGGEPDGQTDILVSEAYRWAFTRDAQYGYAAAYAVLIFLLLFGSSRLFDRMRATA